MNLSKPFRRLTDDDCRRLHEASCRILDRTGFESWAAGDGKDLGRIAAERVDTLLNEQGSEPLPEETRERIQAVVDRAVEQR